MIVRAMLRRPLSVVLLASSIAGCATRAPVVVPPPPPPPDVEKVPDALPKPEPIVRGGPNKPYVVEGRSYTPIEPDADYAEDGLASWYGPGFHGRSTASGELYNMYAMTAAHKTLPIPSYARVTNPANGRSVIVRINDRGPFVKGRIVDLSYTAALKLDTVRGVVPVKVERITPAQIASGAWRGPVVTAAAAVTAPVLVNGDDGPPGAAAAPSSMPPTPDVEPAMVAGDRAPTAAGRGFWVQLGAFREREGAMQMQQKAAQRVPSLALLLAVFKDADNALHRVQAGPFTSREDAIRTADRVREQMLLVPVIVERR
jgi:rare lipoprotein A